MINDPVLADLNNTNHVSVHYKIFTRSSFSRFADCTSFFLFVCVEILRPNQPGVVMSSAVSLPNHKFTGQV